MDDQGYLRLTGRLKEFIKSYPGIEIMLRLDDRDAKRKEAERDLKKREAEVVEPRTRDCVAWKGEADPRAGDGPWLQATQLPLRCAPQLIVR